MSEESNRLRNRVVERRRMRASELVPNDRNPRRHPENQAEALTGLVERVGQVGELYAYHSERQGGALVLVDGHLRREQFGDDEWDVAICDLSDDEADLVLALRDHTASLATFDKATLADLMRGLNTGNDERLDKTLSELAEEHGLLEGACDGGEESAPDMGKPLLLTGEQRQAVDAAVARVRSEGGSEMSEGRCIELVCADYVQGPGVSG